MSMVVVGAPRKNRNTQAEAQWARSLMQSNNFGSLVTDTADRLAHEWAHTSPTPAARENAYYKLEGLQALVKELQIMVEHGLPDEPRQS